MNFISQSIELQPPSSLDESIMLILIYFPTYWDPRKHFLPRGTLGSAPIYLWVSNWQKGHKKGHFVYSSFASYKFFVRVKILMILMQQETHLSSAKIYQKSASLAIHPFHFCWKLLLFSWHSSAVFFSASKCKVGIPDYGELSVIRNEIRWESGGS